MYWTGKSMDNLLSYCGLADARISTSEKDLPVLIEFEFEFEFEFDFDFEFEFEFEFYFFAK